MKQMKNEVLSRVIFFDNLRLFFVICVVLQHAGNAYIGLDWWPVNNGTSVIVQSLIALFDAFLMPSLFYVAGYFAVPSIEKKQVLAFITGKFRRLGIPWLVLLMTVCPILPFIYHYTRDGLLVTTSYWETWLEVMKNALQFNVGIMPNMLEVMEDNLFYQRYMWFLGLLLLFFVLFGFIYKFKRNWFDIIDFQGESSSVSIFSTVKTLLLVGLITCLGSVILIMLTMMVFAPGSGNPEVWFTLGNIIQFRLSRIFLHVFYFSFGILTYKRQWIQRGKFPGHLKTWLVTLVVLLPAFWTILHLMLSGIDGYQKVLGLVYWIILNFMTITMLGFCLSLAVKYLNRPTSMGKKLAANSYNMYLAHYIFVLTFQLLLLTTLELPALIKYLIVSVLSAFSSYLTCLYLIQPFPRATVSLLFGLFVAMALFIHP